MAPWVGSTNQKNEFTATNEAKSRVRLMASSLGSGQPIRVRPRCSLASMAENSQTESHAPRLSSNGTANSLGSGSRVLSGSSARLVRLASKAHLP